MARLARILILLLLPLSAWAQDSTYARRIVCDLASPAMYGRGMQHRGDSVAAEYLRGEMKNLGLLPLCKGYYQYFRYPQTLTTPPVVKAGYRSQNICGYLPGEVDTMVVFTAHYEHLGMHGDTLFPGAHDNASGTAAVLDMARMAAQAPRHYTLVFILFGGEEAGLVGSHWMADNPLIDFPKVKLLVNIDLFCGGDEGLMIVNANDRATAPYADLMQRINALHGFVPHIGRRDNAPNSDHWYLSAHCPAIFIYTLGGSYGGYHNPYDTCERCGLDHYHNHMLLLCALLEQL